MTVRRAWPELSELLVDEDRSSHSGKGETILDLTVKKLPL